MKRTHLAFATIVTLAALAAGALADGMIVPVRPDLPVRGEWSVKHHHVNIVVKDDVATVTIDQEFVNHGSGDLEVEYIFPLPPESAVHGMTLLVDGKELGGKIMEAKEARKIYEDIVRKKKDPALLEYVGYGMYRTRAFPLQPNKPSKVVINYTAVCKKDSGLVEVFYPLNTEKFSAKKIEEVRVVVDVKARADITAMYSPSHDLKVEKDKDDPRHAVATYEIKEALPDTDFVVYYRAADEKMAATVLSSRRDKNGDGYFLALVSPSPRLSAGGVASKDVVVVLDRSGSMAQDRKLDQAKAALRYILTSLAAEDRFNVIAFSDSVDPFFAKLVDVKKKNVDEALDSLDRIDPSGGTNIDAAIAAAMKTYSNDKRPHYLLFITDGVPTVGERNEGAIVENARKANDSKVRLFALGVGYDANAHLIDNLVRANHGYSDYVRPKEPLEAKISGLYNKVSKPVMTDVKLAFGDVRVRQTYPQELPDLFAGGQILMVGRYEKGGKTTLKVTGMLDGKEQTFEYPVELQDEPSSKNQFVERLWAVRRVGYLLDQVQLHGENKEVVDELVKLSMDYAIVTPYTSFLADESVELKSEGDMRRRTVESSGRMSKAGRGDVGGGWGAQADAVNRKALNEAEQVAMPTARPATPAPNSSVGQSAAAPAGAKVYGYGYEDKLSYEKGKEKSAVSVQNVGNQALYRRGKTWVTPETAKLDLVKDAGKIKEIQRFGDEYFELVRQNTLDENRVLASQQAGEDLLIRLRGQVYRIR